MKKRILLAAAIVGAGLLIRLFPVCIKFVDIKAILGPLLLICIPLHQREPSKDVYEQLARALDRLPNGFPR
ncbi:MAG: hypothetical protein HXS54_17380, partial [Theionarchaea archaeon]|nr:hypothetical protein [Theionarchaea archaeon]